MGYLRVEKKLGQGSYGSVYLAFDSRLGKHFVMKRIKVKGLTDAEIMDCKKEIEILSMLKHPNIIKYKRSFLAKGSLCILMDFAEKGDLYQIVKEQKKVNMEYFPEDRVMNWFVQSCLGLQHIHSQKILHRDIKTKNIFLTADGIVKIGDFGISKILGSTDHANSLVGAPYYMSPEMLLGKAYTAKTDVWSMGVVLYELLTLQHPFLAKNLEALAKRIIEAEYAPLPKEFSPELTVLLSNMLKKDANERWTLDQVLEFPFCKKVAEELKELLAEKFLLQCKEESEDQEKESKSKPIDEITDDEL